MLTFDCLDNEKIFELPEYLKEYLGFKNENKEFIIFFQVGSFFEIYFDDAKTFSEISACSLNIKTHGDYEIYQAGFPKNSLNIYLKKILDMNYKVAICEQVAKSDDKTIREITRKYTKGTICEKELLETYENNFIAAIKLINPKKDMCEFAYADVSTGQFFKTRGTIAQIDFELHKISPCEVLINKQNKSDLEKITSGFLITYLENENFKSNIENVIMNYCMDVQKCYFAKLDDNIIDYKIANYMGLDEYTRINLELTRTKGRLKKKGSLFWFLNYTKTPMGTRFLKKIINEPLLDKNIIENRLNAVEELILNKNKLEILDELLEDMLDLSRICARIYNYTINSKDLFQIALCIEKLKKLNDVLSKFKNDNLKINSNEFEETLNLAQEISDVVCFNSDISNGENDVVRIIKEGYSSNLDYLFDELKKFENIILKYEQNQKKKTNYNQLSVKYLKGSGYLIEIQDKTNFIPQEDYRLFQKLKNCARYKTQELIGIEEKIINLKYKIEELQKEIFKKVVAHTRQFVDIIRFVSKDIAKVDVFVSFAHCAIENNLAKPEIVQKDIKIKSGCHPSLIKLKNLVVKNDTDLKDENMIILTGANMSGKSTYLRHNAIICLLAQIGSFVPAKNAQLPIIDKIFLRQGSNDDIVNNNSSFMVEMNDLKFILDNATDKSLIVLDEPAKSTNASEGGAIVKAFCDYLIKNYKSKAIIVTHNFMVTKLEEKYKNKVTNYVLGTSNYNDRILRKGVANNSQAISTAYLAQLPSEIIENAQKYLSEV